MQSSIRILIYSAGCIQNPDQLHPRGCLITLVTPAILPLQENFLKVRGDGLKLKTGGKFWISFTK